MSRYNKNLGDFGEMTAERYLISCGFSILKRNFCVKGGEIDIIAENEKFLVFVEVKTRSSERFGIPSAAVDKNKIKHMLCAAERYVAENPCTKEIRFDVIEVYADINSVVPTVCEVNHIAGIVAEV